MSTDLKPKGDSFLSFNFTTLHDLLVFRRVFSCVRWEGWTSFGDSQILDSFRNISAYNTLLVAQTHRQLFSQLTLCFILSSCMLHSHILHFLSWNCCNLTHWAIHLLSWPCSCVRTIFSLSYHLINMHCSFKSQLRCHFLLECFSYSQTQIEY